MAASKPPKHDFAPSWLKIPNQETSKSDRPSCRSSEQRGRRDNDYRYNDYHNYPLPRQRSFDSYEDHPRPYVQPGQRHSSFEDDYHTVRTYYQHNGYDDMDRSHLVLHRSGSRDSRDGKYPRYPHSQMNGHGYPPGYYDYPYQEHPYHHQTAGGASYREGRDRDYYNGYGAHGGRHRSEKHHSGGSDYDRKEVMKENNGTGRNEEEKVVKLDEEFPSLNGDADTVEQRASTAGKVTPGVNAWETPPKVQAKSSKSDQSGSPDLQRKDAEKTSSSIYKALVPNKSVSARKSGRDNKLSVSTHPSNKSLTNGKLSTMTNSNTVKHTTREVAPRISPTPPTTEILTSRLITQPKNIGDKKSEFLRTLKKTSPSRSVMDINSNDRVVDTRGENTSANSLAVDVETVGETMERLSVESTDSLSSSLEAEQRLLKEMGWKEMDEEEEEYVITEDDKKAVENQMRQCPNRNGVTKPGALQLKSWSPSHLSFPVHTALPALPADDLANLSSSSYSDSDSD